MRSMTLLLDERSVAGLEGAQRPRVHTGPRFPSSAGDEAIDLAAHAGLHLDPWQQFVLRESLGEKPDGGWAAPEVGLIVSRQNGKGAVIAARTLAGLFLFDEQLILHTAHLYPTASEGFDRLKDYITGTPDLMKRVKTVRTSHGEEGIILKSGQRVRFLARTKGSGRGFSADVVFIDEAMYLDDRHISALLPTTAARPNPQIWYTGSAGTYESVVLGRVHRRGRAGDSSLCYMEWSIDENEYAANPDLADDPQVWAQANPGVGYRQTIQALSTFRRSLGRDGFAREFLAVGDYPPEPLEGESPLAEAWRLCLDETSTTDGPVAFGVDMTLDRGKTSIGVADSSGHLELVENRSGSGWVVERVKQLRESWQAPVFIDPGGPAGSLIADFEKAGVPIETVTAREFAQACGNLNDAVLAKQVRHIGEPRLTDAVINAVQRKLADAWVWERRTTGDSSPLLAVTLARHGVMKGPGPSVYTKRDLIVL
jgi:hypothetical protein